MPLTSTFNTFGKPEEVITLTDTPAPPLQQGEVRLRMLAAPINPADINYIQGVYGIKPNLPARAGLEGCGKVIESLSPDYTEGDKVIGIKPIGTWAQEVVCPATSLLKIPSDTPEDQAAMLKVNPLTAWCMLTQYIQLEKGSWVIQNAANSGVGTCVIQIAKILGLRTINLVRREEPIEQLKKLGGDCVLLDNKESILHIQEILKDTPPMLALNAVGGDSALRLMSSLGKKAHHITYGAMSRRSLKVPNSIIIFKQLSLHGFWVTEWAKEQIHETLHAAYAQLDTWIRNGQLTQPVDSVFPLTEIKAALIRAQEDNRDGKVIIRM